MRPTYEELLKENAELKTQLAQALQTIRKLEARVAELEARLGKTSQNSSRPPSTDPPKMKGLPKKPPTGRKPGGQPGHEGHQRPLLPPEQMDERLDVKPPECHGCGAALRGNDPDPQRHQVVELPERKAHWAEYRLHTLTCPRCGEETTAELPDEVPRGAFGPKLQAFIALCTGAYHLTKRQMTVLLSDWWNIPMSLGSVTAAESAVSRAVAPSVVEAEAYLPRQKFANVDETGWYVKHHRAWMWVAVTMCVTVFKIHAHRNTSAALTLLGRFRGVLSSDRFKVYLAWVAEERQLCWAHLIRDFRRFAEMDGVAAEIGTEFLDEAKLLFDLWYRVRDGTLSRSGFRREMVQIRWRVRHLLKQGARCRAKPVRATCRELLKLFPALWTFAYVKGVEPTINAAEWAIRPAVIWRKICYGTQSGEGCRFAERILTVVATLKQQRRNVADFVIQACEAALYDHKAPSLLPTDAMLRTARQPA